MTMKEIKCSDLGSMDCDFAAAGKTAAVVKKAMYTHAARDHPDVLRKMTDAQQKKVDKLMDRLLA